MIKIKYNELLTPRARYYGVHFRNEFKRKTDLQRLFIVVENSVTTIHSDPTKYKNNVDFKVFEDEYSARKEFERLTRIDEECREEDNKTYIIEKDSDGYRAYLENHREQEYCYIDILFS